MRGGFTLVELLVVISIIATLAGIGIPVILSKVKEGYKTEAVQNIRQIGVALFSFEQEYGSYPCDSTAEDVRAANPDLPYSFGNTFANDFFRQLIATKKVDQEKPFYVKCAYTKKPDNIMTQGKCLAPGECGFAYIMASQTEPLSSGSGRSDRPLLASVVYNCRTDGSFDPDVFGGKAVLGRIDQSVTTDNVRSNDKMVLVAGKKLLEAGKDSVWGDGVNPIIKPPWKAHAGGTSQLPNSSNEDNKR